MTGALAPFLAGWSVMMAAMMLPSAIPMIRLHRIGATGVAREVRTVAFVAGYLLLWSAVGLAVWGASLVVEAIVPMDARRVGVAALLILAGVYQVTPLKERCLGACRSGMDFLVTHWHDGIAGALRTGVEHGVFCVGCCWALMAVFVGVGAMELPWAVAIAGVVLVEKVFARGRAFSYALGAVLIVAGAISLVEV